MPITHSKVSAKSDGGDSSLVLPSDWNDDHVISADWFKTLNLLLEPLAIEELQYGTFSYGITTSKLALATWNTRLGSAGRLDIREQRIPRTFKNVTFTGLGSTSTGAFINSGAPVYSTPFTTYYERLRAIAEDLDTHYVGLSGGSATARLLPSAYGIIVTGLTFHDTPWVGLYTPRGPSDSLLAIHDEIGDASGDDLRMSHGLLFPASKNIVAGIKLGVAGGPDSVLAGLTYVILPSSWGAVTDATSYDFRDDFLGSSLDTGSDWNRTESTAGNVEISTTDGTRNWLHAKGNGTWGDNGCFSQTGVARAQDKVFLCDVSIDPTNAPASNAPNLLVGWHDGAGYSYTDFAHAVDFTTDGTARLTVFENGTSRGNVGSGWVAGCTYRVRITLDPSGASNTAKYEIQGGTAYQPIGGSSWTDITPGTTSSSTSPVYAGVSVQSAFDQYINDVRLY